MKTCFFNQLFEENIFFNFKNSLGLDSCYKIIKIKRFNNSFLRF